MRIALDVLMAVVGVVFALGMIEVVLFFLVKPRWKWLTDHWCRTDNHRPGDKMGFDGASFTSRCRWCGCRVLQDSQGGWFKVSG